MTARKSTRKNNYNNPNFWGMIQNVLIASLNKGQLITGFLGLCFLIMIQKTPKT